MRTDYIKEHHHSIYLELVFAGKWHEYLHGVDEKCYQRMELLVVQNERRSRDYRKAEGDRPDEMGWTHE